MLFVTYALCAATAFGCQDIMKPNGEVWTDVDSIIVVMDGNSEVNFGVPTDAKITHLYSQHIYIQKEIGRAGIISAIQLRYHSDQVFHKEVTVAMGHTTKREFQHARDWTTDMQTVFEGNLDVRPAGQNSNAWVKIALPTGFHYDNKHHLVVAICARRPDDSYPDGSYPDGSYPDGSYRPEGVFFAATTH